MALLGLNRLHLHLTDDQGWRIDVPGWPRLREFASVRAASQTTLDPNSTDGIPHGGCYTDDELRGLVAYAEARGVIVVPEIDMPGHMTAAIAAYPHLGNVDVSGRHQVSTRWGVHDTVLNLSDAAIAFCEAHGSGIASTPASLPVVASSGSSPLAMLIRPW